MGTTFVYDIKGKRFFKYDSDNFYFQTRVLQGSKENPISIDRVAFEIERTEDDYAEIIFNVKYEDRDWSNDITQDVVDKSERTIVALTPEQGRSFSLKITEIPDDVKIRRLWISQTGYTPESRGGE